MDGTQEHGRDEEGRLIQVFKDRDLTPCMAAYEKWWNEQGKNLGIPTDRAWIIFRNGWWMAEESKETA